MASVLERSGHAEITLKRSRFLAYAKQARTREAALDSVARTRAEHPDARHHCFAYLIGESEGSASAAMNDDGEPSGTAGKPIMNVIRHRNLTDVVVVVVRYFGGIKLGAGGLVRAYACAAEAVLSDLPVVERRIWRHACIRMPFAGEQTLRHWCDHHRAVVDSVRYGEGVVASIRYDAAHTDSLIALCGANGLFLVQE